MSGRIVIAGCMAQKPYQAGHTWQYLQYLLGFRRLGWDVLFVDRLSGEVAAGDRRVGYVADVFGEVGLEGCWTIGLDDGSHAGLGRAATLERVRSADLLLNVMGYCDDRELLAASRRRVFLDTDPGFGQMWHALGLADIFAGHDAHVTIGERIGRDGCTIPDCGLHWITTPQPVVLDAWPATPPPWGGCDSPASAAGAAPTGQSTTTVTATGCACTSCAGSLSFRRARPPASSWRSISTPTSATTWRCCAAAAGR